MTEDEFARKWIDALLGTQATSKAESESLIYSMYERASWKRPQRIVWCGSPVGAALVSSAYAMANKTSSFGLLSSLAPSLNTVVCQRSKCGSRTAVNLAAYWEMARVIDGIFPVVTPHSWWPNSDRQAIAASSPVRSFGKLEDVLSKKWNDTYVNEIRRCMPKFDISLSSYAYQFGCRVYDVSIQSEIAVRMAIEADWLWRFEDMDAVARSLVSAIQGTELVIPFNDVCFISERKLVADFNSSGQLHKDGGPALAYPDGLRIYSLNGVRVTKEVAETPAEEMDPRLILAEQNADVRRELVRKIGAERVCAGLGTKVIDTWENYELLILDLGDGRRRPYLKMLNPSIGTFHIEGVHPDCTTVKKALAWRNNLDEYVKPDQLT